MILSSAFTDSNGSYLAFILFLVFAVLAAAGGFWIVASHKGRRAGWLAGGAIFVSFVLLFAWMRSLLAAGGLA
jgi:hypothetical protein